MLRSRHLRRWVVALGFALGASACAGPVAEGSLRDARFPPGQKVFINHRGMVTRIQDPDHHMALARRAYERGRFTLAALEVEKVAGGVRWFEERAAGEHRRRIREAHLALRQLEKKLRRREVDSVRLLDDVFADTLDALMDRRPARDGLRR